MNYFVSSSLFALALATAHGAILQSADNNSLPANHSPTSGEVAIVQKNFEGKEARPVIVALHQNNDGAKVTIPSGALVKVILEANTASTGFDWSPTFSSSDVLTFQSKNIKKASSYLIGAGTKESWIFKATTSGQTLLTFSLDRSWEKNVSPIQTVQFDITVE